MSYSLTANKKGAAKNYHSRFSAI